MTGSAYEKDILINSLVEDYTEKIFYFCLKKTGDAHEAEDLTSDIFLNVITALNKGVVPEHLSAWIWRIAHNLYSKWCNKKHRRAESVSDADIEDFEIEDITPNPEEALMHKEKLQLLRRELSFISSDYRNILVAYYMQSRKISDIALLLGLPEGTVTSKLCRARKTLKEGMNMAREFGKKSYCPEEISFYSSGSQPVGLPSAAIRRKIPVNILCEAHNNPCTLQELSLELGIALPYMEEEAELLVKAELLKKLDNGKYLTNFFITPKECQNKISDIICTFTEGHFDSFWHLAEKALKKAVELGITTGGYSDNDAQMFFAFNIEQQIENSAFSDNLFTKFNRADGGTWGIIGFERGSECRLPIALFSNSINYIDGTKWDGYQAHPRDSVFTERRYDTDVPESYLNSTLKKLANETEPNNFSDIEKENLQRLIDSGFCKNSKDAVYVNALVFQDDMKARLDEYLNTLPEYTSLLNDMKNFIEKAKEVVAEYSNKYLQDDFEYYVGMSVVELRFTLSRLWKDNGLYKGKSAQFCAFYC